MNTIYYQYKNTKEFNSNIQSCSNIRIMQLFI